MEFPSVNDDWIKSAARIIAPGAIAVGPYIIVLAYYVADVKRFWLEHDTAFGAIVSIGVVVVGLLLEEIGALTEGVWDSLLTQQNRGHLDTWYRYLALKMKDEYVAERYIQRVLVNFKFELSMVPAVIAFATGLIWIQCLFYPWEMTSFVEILAGLAALTLFLLWESYQSADLLSRTRTLLVDAARVAADTARASGSPN
jgi:hypothetical protein